MKAATIQEIRRELQELPAARLTDICLRLARFKSENKELLSFLLFSSGDIHGYLSSVKMEMNELFEGLNHSNVYFEKKGLRKILRTINRHTRYLSDKPSEAELLIYFCEKMVQQMPVFRKNQVLLNIYDNQLKKAQKIIDSLHEDLQYDLSQQIRHLSQL